METGPVASEAGYPRGWEKTEARNEGERTSVVHSRTDFALRHPSSPIKVKHGWIPVVIAVGTAIGLVRTSFCFTCALCRDGRKL